MISTIKLRSLIGTLAGLCLYPVAGRLSAGAREEMQRPRDAVEEKRLYDTVSDDD
jgi:hypothetical protein